MKVSSVFTGSRCRRRVRLILLAEEIIREANIYFCDIDSVE